MMVPHFLRRFPAYPIALVFSVQAIAACPFAASLDLSSLNGANGFVCNGVDANDFTGISVSGAGDINDDGIDDFIIGAERADSNAAVDSGECYVIFGGPGAGAGGTVELSSLDGFNGFVINGINAGDRSGVSVSAAGDVNEDGIDDLIIGADHANPNGLGLAGQSYVVFGGAEVGIGGVFELGALNGANGFVLNGIDAVDESGRSVSGAGDVNGDGVDDIIIGAIFADPNGQASGECYIVFGGAAVGAGGTFELSSLNGINGFVCRGIDEDDYCGASVSAAGDFNGDGFDDVIIGAIGTGINIGDAHSGESYVVFGGVGIGASGVIELSSLDGSNGFVCHGVDPADLCGTVAAAGDVNADGFDDLIIGAHFADTNSPNSGESYIVYGGNGVGLSGSLNLSSLNGVSGFTLSGIDRNDLSGRSVSSAGDMNGDGIDDLIVGAPGADPNGVSDSGECYVLFGCSSVGLGGSVELASLDGTNGFVLNGIEAGDGSGMSVSSTGDINADGIDDLVIGAPSLIPDGSNCGEAYVVFGRCVLAADINDDNAVDMADLGLLIDQFGAPGLGADLNGDSIVDTADLGILIGAFGTACP